MQDVRGDQATSQADIEVHKTLEETVAQMSITIQCLVDQNAALTEALLNMQEEDHGFGSLSG